MNPRLRAITYSSYAGMFFLGAGISLIGAAARNIGLDPQHIGWLLSTQHLGFVVAVLITGVLAESRSKSRLMLVASLALGISFLAFYVSPDFRVNLLVVLLLGIGIGIYEGTADAMLLDVHQVNQTRYININHFFTTAGAVGITLYLIFMTSWRPAVVQAGVLLLVLALFFWRLALPSKPAAAHASFPRIPRKHIFALLFVTMVLSVGIELGAIGFLTTFLMDLRGFTQTTSKIALVLFLAGEAVGRLLLGMIAINERIPTYLLRLLGLSAALFGALFFLDVGPLLYVLSFCAGAAVSALCPLIVSLVGLLFPNHSARLIGAVKIGIPVGGMTIPFLMAVLTPWVGLTASLAIFPLTGLAAWSILAALARCGHFRQLQETSRIDCTAGI